MSNSPINYPATMNPTTEVVDESSSNSIITSDAVMKPALRISWNDVTKISEYETDGSMNDDSTDDVIIPVETFSPNLSSLVRPAQVSSSSRRRDAFLYYSNDDLRLNILKSGTIAGESSDSEEDQPQLKRKTKISFEISHLLMLEDMLDEF